MKLGGFCGNLTALLSAHQSIGAPAAPHPLRHRGAKAKYLPRCAKGEISAFALTEANVGSDPARMTTHAELDADGTHYLLNGEKLWTTNGTKAGLIVVMARTPLPDKPNATTAFIVETAWPGVSKSPTAAASWACAPSTTASCASRTSAFRSKTSSAASVAD
jgi:alkylation response protein AidB-like acyl-CoA dehydrogenase